MTIKIVMNDKNDKCIYQSVYGYTSSDYIQCILNLFMDECFNQDCRSVSYFNNYDLITAYTSYKVANKGNFVQLSYNFSNKVLTFYHPYNQYQLDISIRGVPIESINDSVIINFICEYFKDGMSHSHHLICDFNDSHIVLVKEE